ncbi:MAG: hypothetical protein HDT13_05105 [Butyrivibrio sp.]|nr:hypothetical protein [Butyrivibrio sp.]
MRYYFFNKITALFTVICLLFIGIPVYAETMPSSGVEQKTLKKRIPESVTEYIEDNFSRISEAAADLSGISSETALPENTFSLGKPYIVYRFSEYQDEIYYYPLILDGKTEAILGIIGTDQGYTHEIARGGEMQSLLNKLDYSDNECIFYVIGNELYCEIANIEETCLTAPLMYGTDCTLSGDEILFLSESFEEKQRIIVEKVSSFKSVDTQNFSECISENIRYGAMKTVALYKQQSQYAYEMCWACVVATIINTLNHTSYTGYDICNRMGIGFDTGAEIEEMKTAFSYYAVNYKKTNDALSWDKIKQNIDSGYPIAMLMVPYYVTPGINGHSVTLYGYDSSNHYIRIWNSQNRYNPDLEENENNNPFMEGYSVTINYNNQKIILTDGGLAYLWNQTLSQYN